MKDRLMINLKALLLAGLIGMTAFSANLDAKAIYKWKDEKGNIQYSQTKPPKGVEYTVLNYRQEKAGVSSSKGKSATTQVSPEDEIIAKQEAQKEQIAAQQNDLNQKNCKIAQNNLQVLESQTRIQIEEDGKRRMLTDKERSDRLADAKKNVDKFCK